MNVHAPAFLPAVSSHCFVGQFAAEGVLFNLVDRFPFPAAE
jgi:hypothetical protein